MLANSRPEGSHFQTISKEEEKNRISCKIIFSTNYNVPQVFPNFIWHKVSAIVKVGLSKQDAAFVWSFTKAAANAITTSFSLNSFWRKKIAEGNRYRYERPQIAEKLMYFLSPKKSNTKSQKTMIMSNIKLPLPIPTPPKPQIVILKKVIFV